MKKTDFFKISIILIFCVNAKSPHAYMVDGETYTENWLRNQAYRGNNEHNLKILRESAIRKEKEKVEAIKSGKSLLEYEDTLEKYHFIYNPAVSAKVKSRVVDILSETTEKSAVLKNMKGLDIVGDVGNKFASHGYEKHSVATAMMYWIVVNMEIATRKNVSNNEIDDIMEEMEAAMMESDKLGSMSDEEKQEMAETLIWEAAFKYQKYKILLENKADNELNGMAKNSRESLKKFNINKF